MNMCKLECVGFGVAGAVACVGWSACWVEDGYAPGVEGKARKGLKEQCDDSCRDNNE